MPIKIPSDLPAFNVLRDEGVMVMDDFKANRQDIRPLKIGLLNLMPKKIQTEKQIELVGEKLRSMMPWITSNKLVNKQKN